ncbi:hypothetical protein SAMN02910358_01714 [Lachnospiraceae bacterium XBB1006]|nr:hypothetical protein SAMN02910358_01714 [Lachnospiraceae bacterium XBB1006]
MKQTKRILWGIFAAFIVLAVSAFVVKRVTRFEYGKCADDVAISMKQGDVKLRELTYYFMVEEESVNEQALTYNPDNPKEYWGLYINNAFVNKEAKNVALKYFLRDRMYAGIAMEAGMKLSKSEKAEIKEQAKGMYENLTEKQKTLDITEEDLRRSLTENKLAGKWVISLAEKEKLTMSEEVLSAYYGIHSDYFKEQRAKSNVHLKKELLDHISLGGLTIN